MSSQKPRLGIIRKTILVFGCALSLWLIIAGDLQPNNPQVSYTAGVAVFMATLWMTEAIPLAATALLPLVWFPIFGTQGFFQVASQYCTSHILYLFIGGFIVALAMQRWNLHSRIALRIMLFVGTTPARLLLGFMIATAFLSMWISNTATAMMMVTIAAAVISSLPEDKSSRLAIPLMLGIAYSASIGGIGTIVGTPPNLAFVEIFEGTFPEAPAISFITWMKMAVPISLTMFALTWLLLWTLFLRRQRGPGVDRQILLRQYRELGPMSWPERVVLVDFVVLVMLWVTRAEIDFGFARFPGWASLLPEWNFLKDGFVALLMASLLFFIPSKQEAGQRIMNLETAIKLPWHIVVLFGGGFALASGFNTSGLSDFLGQQMEGLSGIDPLIVIAIVCLVITFMTELTSNTATTQMILPIMATLAVTIGVHPMFLMIPVTISCSCAFMMPVATPPNAIVFGTGHLRVADMARVGLILNLIGVAVVVTLVSILSPIAWGFEVDVLPAWAK